MNFVSLIKTTGRLLLLIKHERIYLGVFSTTSTPQSNTLDMNFFYTLQVIKK